MKPQSTAMGDNMISMEEALRIIQANTARPRVQECSLEEATAKYLAEDIRAPEPSPRYTNSAMDGFAVRLEDIREAAPEAPAVLKIVGESRAGVPFSGSVQSGEAIRINTGAMLAKGCDTVVRVEDTEEAENETVRILTTKRHGQDVRHRGEEFGLNDPLLAQGTRIAAPQAALLAAVGIERLKVFAPPRIALAVTGSELAAPGVTIADHQIRDSNMIMLKSAVQEAGATLVSANRVDDDFRTTVEVVEQAAKTADIILCTGGVSVGRHDNVKEAAEANGFAPLFWRVLQKPGKPLYFARKGETLLFGLPGNPVSAFMCFTHYIRPLLGALSGRPFGWPTISAEATADIANSGKRAAMVRVRLKRDDDGVHHIHEVEQQGSHMLTSLCFADGYIILGPQQTLSAGERGKVYLFDFQKETT
ncbi:MAG: molybdopterin molybdotransferase MoeA [Alphaproteobacteria bacterium]